MAALPALSIVDQPPPWFLARPTLEASATERDPVVSARTNRHVEAYGCRQATKTMWPAWSYWGVNSAQKRTPSGQGSGLPGW
jgi:hypothetical protein